MAINPLILYTGDTPIVGQERAIFNANNSDTLAYLKTFGTDLNARSTEINTATTDINDDAVSASTSATNSATSATEAEASATIALNATNYKGDWIADYDTTGYSVGMSVTLIADGQKYVSKLDTNLVEPTSKTNTTEWDYLEAITQSDLDTKLNLAQAHATALSF